MSSSMRKTFSLLYASYSCLATVRFPAEALPKRQSLRVRYEGSSVVFLSSARLELSDVAKSC